MQWLIAAAVLLTVTTVARAFSIGSSNLPRFTLYTKERGAKLWVSKESFPTREEAVQEQYYAHHGGFDTRIIDRTTGKVTDQMVYGGEE